jgi:ankyrin repeat protein
MKNFLTTAIATVFLVGCGPSRAEREMFGAVLKGNIATVKQYLDNGVNVNAKSEPGLTSLHCAVNEDFKGSHRELVKLLIDKGADVNARDDILDTPLHGASNKETAEILIKAGADVNAKNINGKAILYSSARNAANASVTWQMYLDLVELLIAKGADVDVKNESGETPLHVVARQFDEKKASEICELLIANGARVNEKKLNGQTPLDEANGNKRTKTTDLLRKHGGKTAQELKAEGK